MFLRPATLNALMKKAYKSGLTLAMDENEWLYIASDWWQVQIKKEFIPKRTLGDIIALTGELPKPGERFQATKYGNQIELDLPDGIEMEPYKDNATLTVTDMLLIGTMGTIQRLLQDEDTGNIYAVNNVFIAIVDNGQIEKENGEYEVREPLFHPHYGIIWKNNVCRLRAHFRSDDKNEKVMNSLKGVDITPEVPEE